MSTIILYLLVRLLAPCVLDKYITLVSTPLRSVVGVLWHQSGTNKHRVRSVEGYHDWPSTRPRDRNFAGHERKDIPSLSLHVVSSSCSFRHIKKERERESRPLKVSTATLNRKRYTPMIRLDSRFPLLFNRTLCPFPLHPFSSATLGPRQRSFLYPGTLEFEVVRSGTEDDIARDEWQCAALKIKSRRRETAARDLREYKIGSFRKRGLSLSWIASRLLSTGKKLITTLISAGI